MASKLVNLCRGVTEIILGETLTHRHQHQTAGGAGKNKTAYNKTFKASPCANKNNSVSPFQKQLPTVRRGQLEKILAT
jgi:hypothetical protein